MCIRDRSRAAISSCKWRIVRVARVRAAVPRVVRSVIVLGNLDVFAARSLRPLSPVEDDGLALAEFVERRLTARRAVEEVLVSVRRQNEPETFIAHQPLDRPVQSRHCVLQPKPVLLRARALLVLRQHITKHDKRHRSTHSTNAGGISLRTIMALSLI